jgi:hypothetical protein
MTDVLPAPAPASASERAALEVSELHVRYSGVVAVNGVSLRARPGEVLALIGRTAPARHRCSTRSPASGPLTVAGWCYATATQFRDAVKAELGAWRPELVAEVATPWWSRSRSA